MCAVGICGIDERRVCRNIGTESYFLLSFYFLLQINDVSSNAVSQLKAQYAKLLLAYEDHCRSVDDKGMSLTGKSVRFILKFCLFTTIKALKSGKYINAPVRPRDDVAYGCIMWCAGERQSRLKAMCIAIVQDRPNFLYCNSRKRHQKKSRTILSMTTKPLKFWRRCSGSLR